MSCKSLSGGTDAMITRRVGHKLCHTFFYLQYAQFLEVMCAGHSILKDHQVEYLGSYKNSLEDLRLVCGFVDMAPERSPPKPRSQWQSQ